MRIDVVIWKSYKYKRGLYSSRVELTAMGAGSLAIDGLTSGGVTQGGSSVS